MSKILAEIQEFLNDFNKANETDLDIDTIRIEFSKEHKKKDLEALGRWHKISLSSNISAKLKKKLVKNEITSALQLDKENIYYFNSSDAPKYRRATMVIFGLKQYTSEAPNTHKVKSIINILKDVSNIDLCFDMPTPPNIEALRRSFYVQTCVLKGGIITSTHYINTPRITMIEKITIYDKANKNILSEPLWRIEFKITIPNVRCLAIPLHDIKEIINTAGGNI